MTARRFMLDTSVVSVLMRRPQGVLAGRVRRHEWALCTSIIVAGALRFGCVKTGAVGILRRAELFMGEIGVLPFEAPADEEYARLRRELEAGGEVIGANDMFIAAHARSLDLVLVTGNVGEFSRVRGLRVESWMGVGP